MSASRTLFCWLCSRRLAFPHFRIVLGPDGHEHRVHAICALEEGLEALREVASPTRPQGESVRAP